MALNIHVMIELSCSDSISILLNYKEMFHILGSLPAFSKRYPPNICQNVSPLFSLPIHVAEHVKCLNNN